MRVHLATLGCRLNEAELRGWAEGFQAAGHQLVDREAEIVVINTCAVTSEAARKSRQAIRRLRREHSRARLIASGCLATLPGTQAAALLGVDLVVPNPDKTRLVEIACSAIPNCTTRGPEEHGPAFSSYSRCRTRAFVKVQDGCRYRCTYCIVTVARGPERSRPIREVVSEINRLVASGTREAVLTGVHLGGYGADTGADLAGLVRAVLSDTNLPRLRLSSLEPWDIPEGFFQLFASPRLLPHLHLPLQSGSDPVLRRMARRCGTQRFADLVTLARREVPDLHITTDIIVGFPGETESEWRDTLAFVEQMRFGHAHLFPFSAHPGTRAAELPNPVDPITRRRRGSELRCLVTELRREFLRSRLDLVEPVLFEATGPRLGDGQACGWGYTPNYVRVAVPGADPAHRIQPVRLQSLAPQGTHLIGTLC